MIRVFKNKKILLTLAVVLLLIFLSFFWFRDFQSLLSRATSPIQAGFNISSQKIYNFFKVLTILPNLSYENKNLKKENLKLTLEIIRLQELARENEALRAQLNLEAEIGIKLLMARVIGREPQNLAQLLSINKGSKENVSIGMPVLNRQGALVGKISHTSTSASQVLLATDPNSSINGLIQESRATGIVKGKYGLGMLMEMICQNEEAKIGDIVITSGLGGEFPQGVFIGKVNKIIESETEIFKKAWIKPAVNFNHLERVFVLLDY